MGMPLTTQTACAQQLAGLLFCGIAPTIAAPAQNTATINGADILAAVQALDAAFDAALSAGVTAYGGSTTVINALAASLPSPASGGTTAQKTYVACCVLLKRAGLI